MDYRFSIGLLIGSILGGIGFMIGVSQWVGIALLSLAVVWGFLFVNPKSPVRKIWWSTSKIGITLADNSEVRFNANDENFTMHHPCRLSATTITVTAPLKSMPYTQVGRYGGSSTEFLALSIPTNPFRFFRSYSTPSGEISLVPNTLLTDTPVSQIAQKSVLCNGYSDSAHYPDS